MVNKAHPTIEEVQRQFEQWRSNRKHREEIPLALWTAAASLGARHSIYKVARALRLNYNDLKERAEGAAEIPSSPAFIELKAVSPATSTECVIEIEKTGAKMKISFKGGIDVFELLKSFWGAGA